MSHQKNESSFIAVALIFVATLKWFAASVAVSFCVGGDAIHALAISLVAGLCEAMEWIIKTRLINNSIESEEEKEDKP